MVMDFLYKIVLKGDVYKYILHVCWFFGELVSLCTCTREILC